MADATHAWVERLRGRFVVFDGPDGSGKSTQFQKFAELVAKAGVEVCQVREPGGTMVGERVRQVLLDNDLHDQITLRCEMLLFMASRAQLVAERVRPALARRELVLADRFISSTLAYQGSAGGLPVEEIRAVGQVALGNHWPDLVVVFDVDEQTAASRLNPLLDRMEMKGREYHRAVRQGYLEQAAGDPDHYLVIDARDDEETVFDRLVTQLASRFPP